MIYKELQQCRICPRNCGVNRYLETGYCQAPAELKISLAQLHFGEEPSISGSQGSGTIFFSHCNLRCVFCQNHVISWQGSGQTIPEDELLQEIFDLQELGAHNINLVTPTHYSIPLISVLGKARQQGLKIPILWNSSAYENVETLQKLKGLVDIYLPDYKYYHSLYAKKYSHAGDYPAVALKALKEMVAQTGFLEEDSAGVATKGVLLRLLVLPNALSGTKDSLRLLADEFGTKLPLSLMAQYYPAAEALHIPELNRGLTVKEYQAVVDIAQEIGFEKVFVQELSCDSSWTPDFLDTAKLGV
ncbi:MAG: radical SAM protein [Candidatus Cloacimonetes bacterium]|nr:radical SAM protein [Candidatus Cloacimonadota bacterium]